MWQWESTSILVPQPSFFFFDNRGVQLLEKRLWFRQRLSRLRPDELPARGSDGPFAAQKGVEPLAGEGQIRVESNLEAADSADGGIEDGGAAFPVPLDQVPGGVAFHVTVRLPRHRHRRLQSGAKAAETDVLAGAGYGLFRSGQEGSIGGGQLAGAGHGAAEVVVSEGQDPIHQITPGGHELIIVAPHEVVPGEVGVGGLRHVHGQIVAKRVGIMAREVVGYPDGQPEAGGGLAPANCLILIGGDIVREVEGLSGGLAISQKLGRPAKGMEENVVLPDEVVALAFGGLPKITPALRLATALSPLLGGRQVADDVLEPDVDALAFVARQGDGDTPLQVTGDSAILQTLGKEAQREVEDVLAPVLFVTGQPVLELIVVGAEAQHEVLRVPYLRSGAVKLAAAIQQVHGIEDVATVVALIAAGSFMAAGGAGAFHVAIQQESLLLSAVGQLHVVLVDVPFLEQAEEDILDGSRVVVRARGGE